MKKIILILIIIGSACTKHKINEYEINDVVVTTNHNHKKNLKSDLQFISIMYSDLFNNSIPSNKLKNLTTAYNSFGDKNIIISKITHNFLLDPLASIPSNSEMRGNVIKFVDDTYRKFYVRTPSEAESWYLNNLINSNLELEPRDIYFSFLTSEEYKYY
jgi:hypothetical protein